MFAVGLFIILLRQTLEPFVSWCQKRSGGRNARHQSWLLASPLQPQRLALQKECIVGTRTKCNGEVPLQNMSLRSKAALITIKLHYAEDLQIKGASY
ncbi:hypothetical protein BKA64DRAFT_709097 [Cadophora sp. MPI-SDFR-AT-0126]|nr:hypothetical protein BKA64DRAFT_709097 [Leotiomycetes sp. MPI-SDFR-AT-0126]